MPPEESFRFNDSFGSNSNHSLTQYYKSQLSSRPATSRSYNSQSRTQNSSKSVDTADVRKKTLEAGDYLDRHKERFKNQEQAPFTPRTKINNKGKSKLKESRYYAPPLRLKKSTKRVVASSISSYGDPRSSESENDSTGSKNLKK